MAKDRTQLNINIDPELLLQLKSEAIKRGKTLTDFVVEQLRQVPEVDSKGTLEQRLLRIETLLNINENDFHEDKKIGTIFTDEGAKRYGQVAKSEFELYAKNKGISIPEAFKELEKYLRKYPHSKPELVFQILLGTHNLTGLEMTIAYRHGSCAMRSALNDLTNSPLENLNKAFLDAVISKSLNSSS